MESKYIITQPSNSLLPNQTSSDATSPFDTASLLAQPPLWGTLIAVALFSGILVPIYTRIFKLRQDSVSPKPPDQLVCHGCQYFSNNKYLQCALQPTIVLTQQAIDCQDYAPTPQVKGSRWSKRSSVNSGKTIN